MELCIKTRKPWESPEKATSFNPCFNGTMYKNLLWKADLPSECQVSILVLMELCIKTVSPVNSFYSFILVSILVLMELCIKTGKYYSWTGKEIPCFNPCFNGTMYKNICSSFLVFQSSPVSILVLMELCIKTFFIYYPNS